VIELISERGLRQAICDLTQIERTRDGYEITLPQAYHSGHAVVVSVRQEGDAYLVHDSSYAAMLLESLGVRASAKLETTLRSGIQSYGCETSGLRIYRRCESPADVPMAAVLVGCASRLVADQVLKADSPPVFDFKRKLLGRVIDTVGKKRVKENQDFAGHSGSTYRVAAVVLDKRHDKPIAFVEAVADHNAVARRFREFYDLKQNPALAGIDRVAVYDDSRADINSSDVLLLQDVSNPVRFQDSATRFAQIGTA
jgi:hypothetical protein